MEPTAILPTVPFNPIILNCDQGDPAVYEAYWKSHACEHVMIRNAGEAMSYFGESKAQCDLGLWFVSADLDAAIRELHGLVGNAVTDGRFIVVGNGSAQLFQAALYALVSSSGANSKGSLSYGGNKVSTRSTAVVAQAPYYSAYPQVIDYLQSTLFHWAGDAAKYRPTKNETCIEVITSPNNPCGGSRTGLVCVEAQGFRCLQVHDLAYYWPTHGPITVRSDHNLMLFTLSKCTGHAGLRIGWAIVKDPAVAKKMAEFVLLNTIGVSRDSQSRAAGILRAVLRGYAVEGDTLAAEKKLFHWSQTVMESRWARVRSALDGNTQFSQLEIAPPAVCSFLGTAYSPCPAFIWLQCEEEGADCQKILREHGILSRGGPYFGVSP